MDDARSPDGPLDEADARRAADTGNAAGLGLAPGDLPQEEAPPLTLPEQIAVTLARDIVNSRFAEGEKLSEAKLADSDFGLRLKRRLHKQLRREAWEAAQESASTTA